jgi:thioester reductase-like protein
MRMSYFVTGATGFLGRHLIANLLKRKGVIHVLVRKDSRRKLDAIAKKMGWDMKRVVVVEGDMTAAKCGVTAAQVRALNGKIKHFFHLAAIYDLTASAERARNRSARPISTARSMRSTSRPRSARAASTTLHR